MEYNITIEKSTVNGGHWYSYAARVYNDDGVYFPCLCGFGMTKGEAMSEAWENIRKATK